MPLYIGQHKFESIKIGERRLTDTLDGYQQQINAIQNTLDGYDFSTTTLEHMTIRINSVSGNDNISGAITTQGQANIHGPFATLDGALRSLPDTIMHMITLSFDDGAHNLSTINFAEGTARFNFAMMEDGYFFTFPLTSTTMYGGCFIFRCTNGLKRVPGTGAMTVATLSSTNRDFTVSVNPGFATDAYAGYMLRVINGSSDAGWVRAIDTHNGVNFTIAGHFASGADLIGRQVEIVQSAASINIDPVGFAQFILNPPGWAGTPQLVLHDIEIASTVGTQLFFLCSVAFTAGAKISGANLFIQQAELLLDQGTIDAKGLGTSLLVLGGKLRSASSNSSVSIRRSSSSGIILDGRQDTNMFRTVAFLFKVSVNSCTNGIEVWGPQALLSIHDHITGINNTGYGYVLKQGSVAYLEFFTTAEDILSGATGDILIDGTAATHAELNSNGMIIGARESRVVSELMT